MDGSRLQSLRIQRGLTQTFVAELVGVTQPAVQRWENGTEIPGPADKLLELYFEGKHPFDSSEDTAGELEAKQLGKLKLSVADFDELEHHKTKGEFATVRELLASIIQGWLKERREH